MALSSAIHFYSVSDEYGAFSNFAPYPITLGKKRWPTSEHYFQAQKFLEVTDQERVRNARTASLAAREGRDRSKRLRRDWEAVKVSVMRQAVEAKFTQHADLATLLLSTGNADIFEHIDSDNFWGDGGVALRRFHSSERRGVSLDDRDARVRDLAVGLIEQIETLPVGPLKLDFEYLAGLIVDALRPHGSR